jgi:hypothetical protein
VPRARRPQARGAAQIANFVRAQLASVEAAGGLRGLAACRQSLRNARDGRHVDSAERRAGGGAARGVDGEAQRGPGAADTVDGAPVVALHEHKHAALVAGPLARRPAHRHKAH